MNTIKNNVENTLIIKNSKFISFLIRIDKKEDIFNNLEMIKNKYKDANHYCYAYILDNDEKAYDDNEPSNTAGMPMLNVLKKNNLNHILAIVVRYFGGIKLGANGLVRAYSKSITNLIYSDNIKKINLGCNVDLIFDYKMQKQVDFLLKDSLIISKDFLDLITYNVNIPLELLEQLQNLDIKIMKKKDIYI